MDAPTLYHVDRFGAFTGEISTARRSPADKDVVWLIPDGATTEAPPPAGANEVAVLRDGAWSVVPDQRGRTAYDKATGAARVIEEPGDAGAGRTMQAPPSARHVWSSDRWALPLPDARTARAIDVGAELARRNAAGFSWQGVVYQVDDASQARITSLAVLAQVNGGTDWPEGFRFIARDNSGVPFTAAAFVEFATAAAKAVIARRLHARALKDAIDAAETADAVAAIDVAAGWP